jgi:hypothetical protein
MKGEITIKLANKEYKTRLTIDAIIKIEAALDKGILNITQHLSDADIRVHELVVILTHALRGGGNNIKEKDVMKLVGDAGLVPSCQAVAELLTSTLVSKDDSEKK